MTILRSLPEYDQCVRDSSPSTGRAGLAGWIWGLFVVVLAAGSLSAEAMYRVGIRDLQVQGGPEPGLLESLDQLDGNWRADPGLLRLRCADEAYLGRLAGADRREDGPRGDEDQFELQIAFRTTGEVLRGFLDVPVADDGSKMRSFAFTVEVSQAKPCSPDDLEQIRTSHYRRLTDQVGWRAPGRAWLQRQAGIPARPGGRREGVDELDRTFGVFTGGRAVAENLALDREMALAEGDDKEQVAVESIDGVTVKPINWAARLPDEEVAVDPLSLAVPLDQHAVFFRSLGDMLALIGVLEDEAEPLIQMDAVSRQLTRRPSDYTRQMGLDFPDAAARLLPVKSVAVTGGDPYFSTGTDVAVLFESASPALLYQALLRAVASKAGMHGAEKRTWTAEGVAHRGFATADRSFSSHVVRRGDLVVVSNSLAQIKRLLEVGASRASLGASEEYRFFRHRYRLSEEESGFVFVSDATLRRWCGPEWRIGSSRRIRALAAMSRLNTRIIEGEEPGGEFADLLGGTRIGDRLIVSERFGAMAFLTPIVELGIETVSRREAAAYERWRTGYERGWATVFDPIALQIGITGETRKLDLTVLPLTVDSDYEDLIRLTGDAVLSPMARTVPADSLLHVAVAVDRKSPLFAEFDRELPQMMPGLKVNPLAWVGDSISLDCMDDFFWRALPELEPGLEPSFQAPVLLRIESRSRLKLAAFMVAVRAAVETSSPDLLKWETRKHGDRSYVVIAEDENGEGIGLENAAVYYAALPTALLVSLDEQVLVKAMDRELAGPSKDAAIPLEEARQVLFASDPEFVALGVVAMQGPAAKDRRQQESWKALPVLNEWRRRFPGEDAVEFHLAAFGERIRCPGGQGYRWNNEQLTMESVVFGHPAAPKTDPAPRSVFDRFRHVQAGLGFEDGGLRARAAAGPARVLQAEPVADPARQEVLATAADLTCREEGLEKTFRVREPEGESTFTERIRKVTEEGDAVVIEIESSGSAADEDWTGSTTRRLMKEGLAVQREESTSKSPREDNRWEVPPPPGPPAPPGPESEDSPETGDSEPSEVPARDKYRVARPISGKPGFVYSPYTSKPVDVRGIPPGTLVRDPMDPDKTHIFRVPPKGPSKALPRGGDGGSETPDPGAGSEAGDDADKTLDKLVTEYEVPFMELPGTLVAGSRRTYPFSGTCAGDGEEYREFGEVEIRVVGRETVTVPAGRFEDCVRVDFVIKEVSDRDYFSLAGSSWYARGTGEVKSVSRSGGWVSTAELTGIKR